MVCWKGEVCWLCGAAVSIGRLGRLRQRCCLCCESNFLIFQNRHFQALISNPQKENMLSELKNNHPI